MKQKLTKNILCPISYNVATIFDHFSRGRVLTKKTKQSIVLICYTFHDEYQSYLILSCIPFVTCKFVVMLNRYWCDSRDKETFYDIIHSMQCIFIDVILRWIKILKIVHPYVSRERLGTQKWNISRKKEMRNKQDSRIRATLKIILFHCLNFGPTFHANAGF